MKITYIVRASEFNSAGYRVLAKRDAAQIRVKARDEDAAIQAALEALPDPRPRCHWRAWVDRIEGVEA